MVTPPLRCLSLLAHGLKAESLRNVEGSRKGGDMGSFSFTAEITEDRTLTLPPGSPTGRVTVAITPADGEEPSGRRLLAKLHDLQAAIPAREGLSKEQIDAAMETERASWR